jgi:hypothetical protein
MRKIILYFGIVVLFFVFSGCEDLPDQSPQELGTLKKATVCEIASPFIPDELIIKFKEGTADSRKAALLAIIGGKQKEKILSKMMELCGDNEGLTLVETTNPVDAALNALKGIPDVEYAEPNYIYTNEAVSNDTYYTNGSLWGVYGAASTPSNIYGSGAYKAWAAGHTGSATVYVGIIDEGYMYSHEDLTTNAGKNPGEVAGNGIDDDLNGYIDDVYGWDFYNNNNSVFDGLEDDHGTHVAGTIGAIGGNRKGVAGICWNIRLLNAKFLGATGGTTANAVLAIDYFTQLKAKQGLNIVALNNSWSGGDYSQALYDAIQRAASQNILFIASAGNDAKNIDLTNVYPAGYSCSNIISVAAINATGDFSYYSNYGVNSVDIGAPGSGIYSTIPKLS